MKKGFFLCLIWLIGMGVSVQAKSVSELIQNYRPDADYGESAELATLVKTLASNPALNEQKFVSELMSLPFEYRQYVFPALHQLRALSYKTRTMPGIVEWRGKKPTRLAPEVQAFAKDNLEYLSPFLYPSLMPEAWPSYYQNKDVPQKEFIPRVYALDDPQLNQFFTVYEPRDRGLAQRGILPLTAREKEKGDLTGKDVEGVMHVFNAYKGIIEGKENEMRYIRLTLAMDPLQMYNYMEQPCLSITERMYKIGEGPFVQEQLRAVNMTPKAFTNKCDRVINAFRVARVSPSVMSYVVKMKKAYPHISDKMDPMLRQAWRTTFKLFQTSVADVDAIEPYMNQLDQMLRPRNNLMGTPLLLDF